MDSVRIIIFHKNKALRHYIATFLTLAGMSIVDNITSLSELREKAHHYRPHVLLLDIQDAGEDLSLYLQNLRQTLPQVKFVLMGPEPQAYYARHATTMGADLYLSEGEHPHEWLRRLKAIAAP